MSAFGPHAGLQYSVIDEVLIMQSLENDRETKKAVIKGQDGKSRGRNANLLGNGESKLGEFGGTNGAPEEDEAPRLEEMETVRLSYHNILRIDNLVGFRSLTTLCLDNNVIEEISNLSHLINLTWLDLSFNSIKSISGLETLTQLKDLSLHSNQIESIGNLEQCTQLECLSVGKNKINKLENLLYLRQFKKLRLVTLGGNPVCNDPEYRIYVLAHLEKLKYLDYALVERCEVISAREQYQDELLEAEERESLEEANEKAAALHAEYLAKLQVAYLEIVETLFSEMFKEDKEMPKFKLLPGFDVIYDSYQNEFHVAAETTINTGLEIFERFGIEVGKVEEAINTVTQHNEQISIKAVETFNKSVKQLSASIAAFVHGRREENVLSHQYGQGGQLSTAMDAKGNGLHSRDDYLRKLEDLEKSRKQLREHLMTIEIQQVQQLKTLADVFENRGGAIRTERVDSSTQFFRTVEDLENSFAVALENLAQGLVERMANDALDDLGDEALAFLGDRDNLMVAIQGAHDVHLGSLLACEDKMRDGINRELNDKIAGMKKQMNQFNRDRVFEINHMNEDSKKMIQKLVQDVLGTDEDDAF